MPLGQILLNNDEEDKLGMEDSGEYEDFPQVRLCLKLEKMKNTLYFYSMKDPIQLEESYLLPSDVLRSSHFFKSPSKRYRKLEKTSSYNMIFFLLQWA